MRLRFAGCNTQTFCYVVDGSGLLRARQTAISFRFCLESLCAQIIFIVLTLIRISILADFLFLPLLTIRKKHKFFQLFKTKLLKNIYINAEVFNETTKRKEYKQSWIFWVPTYKIKKLKSFKNSTVRN